ncbi:MAG: hypothetical protein QOJ65_511, partial [Fimbriimonadaceae bacterium]|nr:hypothetical protein [Fimbriimonadaceae bacterium]
MRSVRLPTTALLAFGAVFASAQSQQWSWMDQNLFKRLIITGHRELGFHSHTIEGDKAAFRDLTYSGRGGRRFTDSGQISIDGRNVFGVLNFQVQIADNRYRDPETQRVSIDYKKGPVTVNFGDIRGSLLNTNSLASFNRSLKGTAVAYERGRFAAKALRSQAKGSATTISLQGENSAGPYYLQNSRIAKDSVQLQVDGEAWKLGQDYTVNYEIGSVTFINKIIPPTSTIVVTYETVGVNGAFGTIEGVGASYNMGSYGKVGLTSLQQKPRGIQGLSQRTDLFQGFGDPSTPYTLAFEPLRTRPVIVKLQGIIQVEGAHYRFDANNPAVFYFMFPVPATSNIDVIYTPKPIQTVDGERHVTGFDYTLPLGSNKGNLVYNQATGSVTNGVAPMSGTARKLEVNYNLGGWQLKAGMKDVPNTFVGIESTGFLRNEKSSGFSADRVQGKLSYGLSLNNNLIGTRTVNSDGAPVFQNARTTQGRAYLSFARSENNAWRLEHVRSTSRAIQGDARLDTTSLSNGWKSGRLSSSLNYDITTGQVPLSSSGATAPSNIGLNTLRMSTSYNAGAAWTFTGSAGLSSVHTADHDTKGHDISFNAGYKPSQKLDVQFNLAESKSGALAALAGFTNGYGLGYNGNGFSSGVGGLAGLGQAATNYRSKSLSVAYQLSPRINLATRFIDSSARGSISSNRTSRSASLDLD